jgi:sugar O-acyltransferase (sialic acid O-acetyltransferase NeuD family)
LVDKITEIQPDFQFINAIHPKAIISKHIKIGIGVVIVGGAIINPGSEIGDHVIINTKSSVGHDTVLDNYSSIGPGVTLGGNVTIGELSAISIGAVVRNNIKIGTNTVVGANSLVNTDLDDDVLAFGNPAKIIGKRNYGDPYL